MTQQEKLYTYAEYERLCAENPDRRFELFQGEIIEVSPSREHSKVTGLLYGKLFIFHQSYGVGELHIELQFKLPGDDHTGMIPDISFIEDPSDLPDDDDTPLPRMPDLAVEVKSPTNSYEQQRAKARYYLKHGTRLVWLAFPKRKTVEVYRPGEAVLTLTENDMLDGYDVLPGFKLAVKELFA